MAGLTPDPKKRGYLLPPGCKDLIDVLKKQDSHEACNPLDAPVSAKQVQQLVAEAHDQLKAMGLEKNRGGPIACKVSELEQCLKLVFEASGPMFMLHIELPNHAFSVTVDFANGAVKASVFVEMGSERETLLRDFFMAHGLSLPTDRSIPPYFMRDRPVEIRYDFSPMPPDASGSTTLLAAAFRKVWGLTDDSVLNYSYVEIRSCNVLKNMPAT